MNKELWLTWLRLKGRIDMVGAPKPRLRDTTVAQHDEEIVRKWLEYDLDPARLYRVELYTKDRIE